MPDHDGAIELFVGQMVALFPLKVRGGPDAAAPPALRSIFPRSFDPTSPGAPDPAPQMRTRTYPVFVDAPGHGIITLGRHRVEVVILPLDVSTPRQATVFRIVTIAGRIIEVTGVVSEPPAARSD